MGIDREQAEAEYLDSLSDPPPPIGEEIRNRVGAKRDLARKLSREGILEKGTGAVPDNIRRLSRGGREQASAYYTVSAGQYYSGHSRTKDFSTLAPGVGKKKRERYEFDPDLGGSLRSPTDLDPKVAVELSVPTTQAAPISLNPTSSINPDRPRTVAAGYDPDRKVLTVVFRDGTWYNYYDVALQDWRKFEDRVSKGRFIHRYLNGKVRGAASVFGMPAAHREAIYRAARTSQHRSGARQPNQRQLPAKSRPY